MAFRWRADDGPTFNASLVALWLFRGSVQYCLEILYLCYFSKSGWGSGSLSPFWIRPWQGIFLLCNSWCSLLVWLWSCWAIKGWYCASFFRCRGLICSPWLQHFPGYTHFSFLRALKFIWFNNNRIRAKILSFTPTNFWEGMGVVLVFAPASVE